MSADTVQERGSVPQYVPVERRTTAGGLLRSEWVKFWSVRSIVVTMAVSFVVVVALGALLALAVSSAVGPGAPGQVPGLDATAASLQGAQMASLIVAAVGAIVIGGEFSTGMIRTSFTSAPGRLGVLAAKAAVLAVSVAVVTGIAVVLAFVLGQAILDREDAGASFGDDGVVQALVGNVVMLVGVALAGLGVGALLKNTAAAICTVLASIFVVPLLLLAVPESWGGDTIREYWFVNTTTNLVAVTQQDGYLAPGPGAAVFAVWVLVLLGLGALATKVRDV